MKNILISALLLICIGSTVALGAEDSSAPKNIENTDIANMQEIIETERSTVTKKQITNEETMEIVETVLSVPAETKSLPYSSEFKHEMYDGFYMLYSVADDGSAVFEGVDAERSSNNSNRLVIPEKMGGHTIKTINKILPYSPGAYQIYGTNLWKTVTEIVLPETVEVIEEYAFIYLTHLQKLNLPKGIREIGDYVEDYSECDDELIIPPNVKRIGSAFGSSLFTKVTLPEGLEEIGTAAFGNTKFKEIELPSSLKTIGKGAFAESNLKEIYIPDSVVSIGENAFDGNLKKARIPAQFKDYEGIGKAFNKYNIEEIIFDGDITENIKKEFFYSKFMKNHFREKEGKNFIIEDGVLRLYCGLEKTPIIPEGVTKIDKEAFMDSDISNVSFPSTLNTIAQNAFAGSNIKELYFPANVLTVGEAAFYNCKRLERVEFEDKGQKINVGNSAFDECKRLDIVILPKNYNASSIGLSNDFWAAVEKGKNVPRSTSKPIVADKTESTAAPSETQQPEKAGTFEVSGTGENINIIIDGKAIPFRVDKPFIDESNRTQVPVRSIMEHLGCNVVYDDTAKTVEISKLGTYILLTIGSEDMQLNGKIIKMDTSAQIVNDRTYIPVRFIAEALGYEVSWEG